MPTNDFELTVPDLYVKENYRKKPAGYEKPKKDKITAQVRAEKRGNRKKLSVT